ncbi:MAG: mechanosensitive ion channel family protein [Planctomycetes bacterium]|nr:mechanosensitive ion channel family protein [Planctomycetota bacterium]
MIDRRTTPAAAAVLLAWLRVALAAFLILTPASALVEDPNTTEAASSGSTEPAAQSPTGEKPPEDPWNRGTPRSSLYGYLVACREARWADAANYLDLSQIAATARTQRGPVLARQLKFILDRELWVNLDEVSDEPHGNSEDRLPEGRELVGTIPRERGDFNVFMERVPREDGVLIWMLSSAAISRVPSLYDEIGLPKVIEDLPRVFVDVRLLEIALWQWIGLILLTVAGWLVAWMASSVVVRVLKPLTLKSETDVDDRLLALMVGPVRLLMTIGVFNAGLHFLRLSVPANNFAREVSKFLVIAGIAWFVMRVIDLFGTIMKERFISAGQAGAAHLVPVGARAIKVTVFLLTVLATLDTFGFDVTALIAGLGVGGLAVALAAQKTVENVFGGVSVLIDQPVRPGDFCKFGDKSGTVEDIGLRSTRIRTLDRTVVSVPNSEFSNIQIENLAPRDRIRLITTLGLRYETTPDQLRHVIAGLRRILLSHPKVLPEPLRVRFVGFGAYSLDIEMFAYVNTQDINEFHAVREDVFLRVMDVVAQSGSGFAFPSNTTYLARDGGLDLERGKAAEAEIARLRAEGKLMYPNFSAAEIAAMDDTLDWPPKGSVVASP